MSSFDKKLIFIVLVIVLLLLFAPEITTTLCTKPVTTGPSFNYTVDNSVTSSVKVGILNQNQIAQAAAQQQAQLRFEAMSRCTQVVKDLGLSGLNASHTWNDCFSGFVSNPSK